VTSPRGGWIALALAFAAGAGAMALIALIAGLWDTGSPPVILNTERVERAIETSIRTQRHLRSAASCPDNVAQRAGRTFRCEVTVGKRTYPVVVTQLDGSGHVKFVVTR